MNLARAFSLGCSAALLLCHGFGFAQSRSERLEEQKLVMSGFYWRFVRLLDACAIADPAMLKRAQAAIDAVRRAYPRTFEVVESHPAYLGTLYAARIMDSERYKAPDGQRAVLQDCSSGIDLLENPRAKAQYDGYMQHVLELMSTSA